MNDRKVTGGRAPKMSIFVASVDFNFSFAHFFAGKSNKDPAKLQNIMMRIAGMSM